jgi:hypothetical protein
MVQQREEYDRSREGFGLNSGVVTNEGVAVPRGDESSGQVSGLISG